MTATLSRRLLMCLVLVSWGGASCVTGKTVETKRTELLTLLENCDVEARVCAPRELASARAHIAFAIYEAGQGQTSRAWNHLRVAETNTRAAWERSRGDECGIDSDLDGIMDGKDKCPEEPEDYDGDRDDDGCPDMDTDGDGIDDDKDNCPKLPEDLDGYHDDDGCPDVDNDGDGIRDKLDQCPMKPEDRDGFEDIDGCPDPDNDQDKILDVNDNCPMQPEDYDGDQDEDGCPDLYEKIVVKRDRIELKQKVYFATARAKILPQSFDVLMEVADVLLKQPDLNVRIEGHTDSRGGARYNKSLSQKRADSVKAFLVAAKVEGSRCIAVGYGEEVPIDSNDSKDGRARNRRVEFHIIR